MPTVAPLDLEGHVVAVEFLGDVPFFATAAGESAGWMAARR